MTKEQIKRLQKRDLRKLSTKWLLLIGSKQKQFGNASERAREVLTEKGIKVQFV